MRAAFYTKNRRFIIEDTGQQNPGAGEVKISVAYAGICGTDMHVYHGNMNTRVGNKRIIGHEMSGVVSATGSDVTDIKAGDRVTVRPVVPCGRCHSCIAGNFHICPKLMFLGLDADGAFQEEWIVPAETVHVLPDGLSLKTAAFIEPLAVACHDVKRGRVKAGDDVLITGGGPIGLLIALVARLKGASVVLSEINSDRLEIARQMGINTINPEKENLVKAVLERTQGKGADILFEVSGARINIDVMTRVISPGGRIVIVAIFNRPEQVDLFQFFWKEIELLGARLYSAEDYKEAIEVLSRKEIDCDAMITDTFGLDRISEAFETLHNHAGAMKVLIECNPVNESS